jgi:hypothetical protein
METIRANQIAVVAFASAIGVVAGPSAAFATHQYWHSHSSYPQTPTTYSQKTSTFGAPCNSQANDNSTLWHAADDGINYNVIYHRKLGVAGGSSLHNDIYLHIFGELNLGPSVKSGWGGYNCRYIANTTTWSNHAWGIAIDGNTVPNHQWARHCHAAHELAAGISNTFTSHKYHTISCDVGHFEYYD